MRKAAIGLIWMFLAVCSCVGAGAPREQKLVTRVDTATAVLKGHTLVIKATGMAASSHSAKGCQLVRKGGQGVLNKEGLLEYNMVFNAEPGYAGFKMKPVGASFHEKPAPAGVKGARIYSQYNEYDALLPEAIKKKQGRSLLPFGHKKQNQTEAAEQ
jgi:hypothetical protein